VQFGLEFEKVLNPPAGVVPHELLYCFAELVTAAIGHAPAAVPVPLVMGHLPLAHGAAVAAAAAAPAAAGLPIGLMHPHFWWAINTPSWLARCAVCLYGEIAAQAPGWLIAASLTVHTWVHRRF